MVQAELAAAKANITSLTAAVDPRVAAAIAEQANATRADAQTQ